MAKIKGFNSKPTASKSFQDDVWKVLEDAICAVSKGERVLTPYEELYGHVENLCNSKLSEMALQKLSSLLDDHCKHVVASIDSEIANGTNMASKIEFLHKAAKAWTDLNVHLKLVSNLFLHLDRTHALPQHGKPIIDISLSSLRKHLEDSPGVHRRIVEGIIHLVQEDREGNESDLSLAKTLVNMLVSVGTYWSAFEPKFLEVSSERYTSEADEMIARNTDIGMDGTTERTEQAKAMSAFLRHANERLAQEERRCEGLFPFSTKEPLIKTVEQSLVKENERVISSTCLPDMLMGGDMDTLRLMHHLLKRVGSEAVECEALSKSCTRMFEEAQRSSAQSGKSSAVDEMIKSMQLAEAAMRDSFGGGVTLKRASREGFEAAINAKGTRSAELIAKFIDSKLRPGNKGQTELDLENVLDECLKLLRLVDGKDTFEAFFKKHLAKRLILGRSASFDAERSLIFKLKIECGSNFTQKLEGMFKDVSISDGISGEFRKVSAERSAICPPETSERRRDGAEGGPSNQVGLRNKVLKRHDAGKKAQVPEFSAMVITAGFWPTFKKPGLNVPKQLEAMQEEFEAFYLERHQGRRLDFNPMLGQATLRMNLWRTENDEGALSTARASSKASGSSKELICSMLQACVLLCFNDAPSASSTRRHSNGKKLDDGETDPPEQLTEAELLRQTGMSAGDLEPVLQSLCTPKLPLLERVEPTTSEHRSVRVNGSFRDKRIRLKLNVNQLKDSEEEEKENVAKEVWQDRQQQMDAAIVRIMKARKRLSHTLLVNESLPQLRFTASSADLKRRIASLIEREYLERDPSDATVYRYLA